MEFDCETLQPLLDRTYSNYIKLLKPFDKISRYNLIKVFAYSKGGDVHQLLGDLSFLPLQIFLDTASGKFPRICCSERITQLYGKAAGGKVIQKGVLTSSVTKCFIYTSLAGKRYYTTKLYTKGQRSSVEVWVKVKESGEDSNFVLDEMLAVASSFFAELDSTMKVEIDCIAGGVNVETEEGVSCLCYSLPMQNHVLLKEGQICVMGCEIHE